MCGLVGAAAEAGTCAAACVCPAAAQLMLRGSGSHWGRRRSWPGLVLLKQPAGHKARTRECMLCNRVSASAYTVVCTQRECMSVCMCVRVCE